MCCTYSTLTLLVGPPQSSPRAGVIRRRRFLTLQHRGMQQGCLPPVRIDKVGYRGLVPGAEEKGRAFIFPLRLTSLPRGRQAHTLAL